MSKKGIQMSEKKGVFKFPVCKVPKSIKTHFYSLQKGAFDFGFPYGDFVSFLGRGQ